MLELFTDEHGKPFSFYLIPPLDKNEALVREIESHGGVVLEQMTDTIILGDETEPVPAELEEAHIYSYRAIEASVGAGVLVAFTDYLFHFPTGVEPVEDDAVAAAAAAAAAAEEVLRGPDGLTDSYHMELVDNVVSAASKEWMETPASSVRYFEQEEDKMLVEEVRKRPWFGMKGHLLYDEIASLSYFKEKARTANSLRERMRTLNFEVGYMYKVDPKMRHRLLVDANGQYVRTSTIKTKSRKFTAEDDMILSKTVFRQLNFIEDEVGFETVEIPTSFYAKYAMVYPSHTKESYRQRLKNFLVPFGLRNYIIYYMMCRMRNQPALPAHAANVEWLKGRKQLRQWYPTTGPNVDRSAYRMYFPGFPKEEDWLEQNWDEYATVEGEAKVLFENTLLRPFPKEHPRAAHNRTVTAQEVAELLDQKLDEKERVLNDEEFAEHMKEILGTDAAHEEDPANELAPPPTLQFEDAPTTELSHFYKKLSANRGPPVRLYEIKDKDQFKGSVREALNAWDGVQVRELLNTLAKLGVNEYYTLYLLQMCVNVRSYVARCICHYVDTDGGELLPLQPGIWSAKSLEWLMSKDNEKRAAVERYHGEQSTSGMLKDMEKRLQLEQELEGRL